MTRESPGNSRSRPPFGANLPTLSGMPSPLASPVATRRTPRIARITAAAAGLALVTTMTAAPAHSDERTTLRGDSCNHAEPRISNPQSEPVRIGTFNIRADVSPARFSAGVKALLPYVDIVGLQEVNSKDKARKLAAIKRSGGWDFWRQYRAHVMRHPKRGGAEQTPIMWRSNRFVCTYAGPMFASGLISLKGEPDATRDVKRWFTVIHLVDRYTGQRLAIVNVHMLHGAIRGGLPILSRPKHWLTYRTQMTNVIQKVQNQQGYGRVFILGDFNAGWVADRKHRHRHLPYRSFRNIGYTSMWATERPARLGTRRHSLLDQVYSRDKAADAKVLFKLGNYSDHRPAVARYTLPATR